MKCNAKLIRIGWDKILAAKIAVAGNIDRRDYAAALNKRPHHDNRKWCRSIGKSELDPLLAFKQSSKRVARLGQLLIDLRG